MDEQDEVRRLTATASFLQGAPIWIVDYEEFISGQWQHFVAIRPRVGEDLFEVRDRKV